MSEHDHHGHGHSHDHGHSHGHSHGHGHGHHHHHPDPSSVPAFTFALAIGLNAAFLIAEVGAGLGWNSMALLADAGHNLSDVMALALSWGAAHLSQRPPSSRFTYGLKGSSILAAMANAALLWVALGAILLETVRRLFEPAPSGGAAMMIVAAAGIAINGFCALLFAGKSDLNLRAAFQHMLADAVVSAGVVVAGGLVLLTGWVWIDLVASLIITVVIALGSWALLRESVRLGLDAVPAGIDESAVQAYLAAQPGVCAVHDLHIWPMSTTETALTAHLVIPGGHPGDAFLHELADALTRKFGIGHATVQVEMVDEACALHPEGVI